MLLQLPVLLSAGCARWWLRFFSRCPSFSSFGLPGGDLAGFINPIPAGKCCSSSSGGGTVLQRTGRSSRGGNPGFGLGNWGLCWGLNLGFQEVVLACHPCSHSDLSLLLGQPWGLILGCFRRFCSMAGDGGSSLPSCHKVPSCPHRRNGQPLPNWDYLWLSFSQES